MKKLLLLSAMVTGTYVSAQECNPVNLPYLEDLAVNENFVLPDCVTTNAITFTPNIWQVRDDVAGFDNNVFVFYTGNEMDGISVGAYLYLRELNLQEGMTYRVSYKCQNSIDQFEVFQLYADIRIPATAPVYSEPTMLFDAEIRTISDEFSVNVSGTYSFSFSVIASSNTGGIYIDDILVEEVGPTMGVNDITAAPLQLYPNPVKDIINVTHTQAIEKLQLYNSTGQLLKAEEPYLPQARVELSGYPSGIYFVNIESGGNTQRGKLIKE